MTRPGIRTLAAGLSVLAVLALVAAVALLGPAAEPRRDAALGIARLVLNPTTAPESSAAVNFTAPPTARYSLEIRGPGGHAAEVDARADPLSATRRRWSATFEDLDPGTEYRYRIRSHAETTAHRPSDEGDWHRFTTADPESAELDVWWFADVQKGFDDVWPALVSAAVEASPDASLSVHSGDLVDLPAEDAQWDAWFSGLGAAASERIVAPVPGNHEGRGDPSFTAFRSNFSLPDNGVTDETSHTFDYQGVRFVGLDGNRALEEQAVWLDQVLAEDPQPWTVVTIHQPVYSTAMDRSEPLVRGVIGPVLQEHDVDLVLHGHDHGHARGYDDEDRTDTPGVTSGPVYVVANSGPKHYAQQPDGDNTWTRRGATPVARYAGVTTYHTISVRGCRLEFAAVIGAKGPGATTDLPVGAVLDRFFIDRCGAEKAVTNGPVGDDA